MPLQKSFIRTIIKETHLSDIFSVALLIIMSNTMSVLYSHSIGLLHSFTLLTRLIPAFILIHGFAGLWDTRIASEGVRQHKNGRDKLEWSKLNKEDPKISK